MAGSQPTSPTGALTVPTDPLTGLISKALEVTGDVLVARSENSVTPAPIAKGNNASATPPESQAKPVVPMTAMSGTTKLAIGVGVGVVAVALVVLLATRRK